jgi:hypothetical protein
MATRVFTVILGAFLLFGGIHGVVTGQTPGWQSDPQGRRALVSWRSDPGTYLFSIIVYLGGGAALLWRGLKN